MISSKFTNSREVQKENPIVAQLVLQAIHLQLPILYQKIQEITFLTNEINELTWKENSSFILELQTDILKNLCELFQAEFRNLSNDQQILSPSPSPFPFPPTTSSSKLTFDPFEELVEMKNDRPTAPEFPPFPSPPPLPSSPSNKSPQTVNSNAHLFNNDDDFHPTTELKSSENHSPYQTTSAKSNNPFDDDYFDSQPFPDQIFLSPTLFPSPSVNPFPTPFDIFSGDQSFSLTSKKDSLPPRPPGSAQNNQWDPFTPLPPSFNFPDPNAIRESLRIKYFTCPICLNDKCLVDGSIEMMNCLHRFCFPCLEKYLQTKIHSNEVKDNQLICPFMNCQEKISTIMIQGIVTPEDWERYQEYSTSQQLEYEIHYGLGLRCPNQNCKNIVFFETLEEKNRALNNPYQGYSFYCDPNVHGCNQRFCINCKAIYNQTGPAHPLYTCQQYQSVLLENPAEKLKYESWKVLYQPPKDQSFQQYAQREGLRSCPICSAMIQKIDGCDHMTCKICKCNFCFVCGKYNQRNPTKRGDCGPRHGDPHWSHPDQFSR